MFLFRLLLVCLMLVPMTAWAHGNDDLSTQHYIYTCDGYAYDSVTHRYTLPADCLADPNVRPGTHTWLTNQAVIILRNDGFSRSASLLNSTIRFGRGTGRTHADLIREGVIAADTKLQGCTAYGRAVGWGLGDHMLNPYRHFGVWSYNGQPGPGWEGFAYVSSAGLRTGPCVRAPRVRSNSARMADEFYVRAQRAWRARQPGEAMFNLGISLHMLQDANVPSHVHPERNVATMSVRNPVGQTIVGQDVFPAWSNAKKENYAVTRGGMYQPPGMVNGVSVARSPGGWVYWMAATSYPYYPWDSATSAIGAGQTRCDVTNFPEDCQAEAAGLLRTAQTASAGFVQSFFTSMRYY